MKVQNPIIGRSRGSAGGMTFCKNYDKNVARAKAFEVSNPKTPAQQTQRAYFKQLSGLVAQFSDEELRTLFPNKPKSMSRRNAISKQLAEDVTMDGSEKVVDYAGIDTLGNASTMDFGTTTAVFSGNNIVVGLDASVIANNVYADNLFFAALVNETKGEIFLTPNCEQVKTGSLTTEMPAGWLSSHTIHPIPLILDKKDGKIKLVGYGTMGVTKRPGKGTIVPAPTPSIAVVATGLAPWDTFTIDLSGTSAEGGTPTSLVNGTNTVASSFSEASTDIYTGSFVQAVDNTKTTTLTVTMPDTSTVMLNVVFNVQ